MRTKVPLTDSMTPVLRGDLGGGVGDGADRVWNAVAVLDFKISENVSAFVVYRWYDFERGEGGHDEDLQLEGPGAGILIQF